LLNAAKATVNAGGQVVIQVEDSDRPPHSHSTFNTLQKNQDGWEDTMRKLATASGREISRRGWQSGQLIGICFLDTPRFAHAPLEAVIHRNGLARRIMA
jgi:hypothetical protein